MRPFDLSNISVASPCKASWNDMEGDDQVRFCGQCSRNVYNLSNMSRRQAEATIAANEGRVCVRFYRRADGMVLTADCPVAVQAAWRRFLWTAVGGGVAALVALVTLFVYTFQRM